jgi:ribosome assembly protein 1
MKENNPKAEIDEENYQEIDDSEIYFAPEKDNVVFGSGGDGWGFR